MEKDGRKEGRKKESLVQYMTLLILAALTFALESFAREKILRDAVSWKRRSSGRGHLVEFVSECWRVRCITHLWVLIDILRCACSPVCLLCGRQAAKNPENSPKVPKEEAKLFKLEQVSGLTKKKPTLPRTCILKGLIRFNFFWLVKTSGN